MFLDFIPTWIWGVILVVALIGVFSRNKLSNMLGGAGSILGLNRQTTLYVLLGLAVFMGGWGVVAGMWTGLSGTSTASVVGGVVAGSTFGEMTLKIHDGITNVTTTEDTVDATDKFMTFYSADATMLEAEEFKFNISIDRSSIAEDASAKVTCTVPDKDVSASEDNIALKSAGKIILDYVGARNTGTAEGDNAVYTYADMSEGTGSKNIQVKFDLDESYHDAMTDLQDYVDVTCVVESDAGTDQVVARIYADS